MIRFFYKFVFYIELVSKNKILEKVTKIFKEYLVKNNYRNTSERFAILKEIYNYKHHFDVESLYIHMKHKKYRVSRATLYNTIDILLESQLIRKHQFGKLQAQYEKSFSNKQHDHLICTDCDIVIEFCEPRIQIIKDSVQDAMHFKVNRHALNLYGICEKCQKANNILK